MKKLTLELVSATTGENLKLKIDKKGGSKGDVSAKWVQISSSRSRLYMTGMRNCTGQAFIELYKRTSRGSNGEDVQYWTVEK